MSLHELQNSTVEALAKISARDYQHERIWRTARYLQNVHDVPVRVIDYKGATCLQSIICPRCKESFTESLPVRPLIARIKGKAFLYSMPMCGRCASIRATNDLFSPETYPNLYEQTKLIDQYRQEYTDDLFKLLRTSPIYPWSTADVHRCLSAQWECAICSIQQATQLRKLDTLSRLSPWNVIGVCNACAKRAIPKSHRVYTYAIKQMLLYEMDIKLLYPHIWRFGYGSVPAMSDYGYKVADEVHEITMQNRALLRKKPLEIL